MNGETIKPHEAYVSASEERQTTFGYIQLNDLIECLQDYFDGTLDEVNAAIVNLPTTEWHPGNSLWGQLDSDTVRTALARLLPEHRSGIIVRLTGHLEQMDKLVSLYALSASSESFQDYCSRVYIQGLYELSELIRAGL